MTKPHRRPDSAKLAEQFAKWLAAQESNDNAVDLSDDEIRELARQDAEQMKRARRR